MEARDCQLCRSIDPIFVHKTPHAGDFAFLCTPCVLRRHPGSFCPICFDVYDDSPNARCPAADSRAMCHRCPAMAHLTCLPCSSAALRYLCPRCAADSAASTSDCGGESEIGDELGKELLCAARIAALFMRRASVVAKADAERKVKAALVARRRAVEALERAGRLVVNQQWEDESEVDDG